MLKWHCMQDVVDVEDKKTVHLFNRWGFHGGGTNRLQTLAIRFLIIDSKCLSAEELKFEIHMAYGFAMHA